ncbi:MAG: tRNA (N(6)-L-threonylcarbamoyladenosine(37)-C(2))-methylthiotransferase MtaB, partial [Candidatus Thiodiazotropha sp. 6PLUC3]
ETEEEWQETLSFIEEIGFGHLHIFAYSPRQGTKAASLPNPISREIKRQRSDALHKLGRQMKQQTLEAQMGQTLPVLVEGSPEQGYSGYTPNYLRVEISAPPEVDLVNRIVLCHLSGLSPSGDTLQGSISTTMGED